PMASPLQAAPAGPVADTVALRERVRGWARSYCGSCHMASLPSAKPAALAIFNLDADAWSSTLSAARLEGGFTRRLNRRLDEAGREQLRAFVEYEVALRKK
ncbi:MAG: hypothetical protein WA210_22705, partial [Burkholderiaceae bacterium]